MLRLSKLFFTAVLFSTAQAAQADLIVTGKFVVTMDPARRVIANGAVAVVGDKIAAVGTLVEIQKTWTAKQRIDAGGDGIIAPGLINTHTHAPMSLLRGIADD